MTARQHQHLRLITVVETREFQQRAATRMTEAERQDFIMFIAGHPEDGVLWSARAEYETVGGVSALGEKWRGPDGLLLLYPDHADFSLNSLCEK